MWHKNIPMPQPRPLWIGNWSAWYWSSLSSNKADHCRWAICSIASAIAFIQFLPLEYADPDEINNMLQVPEMLCSLAEEWCLMKYHPVQPSAVNHIITSLGTFPFIPRFSFGPLKTVIFSSFRGSRNTALKVCKMGKKTVSIM